jgi:hypothetical protein
VRALRTEVSATKAKRQALVLRHPMSQGLLFLLQTENVARINNSQRLKMAGQS